MATRKKIPLIDSAANLDLTGQVAIAGSGAAVITFPSTTATLATLADIPVLVTGPTGPTGPTGADSTVTGPTGTQYTWKGDWSAGVYYINDCVKHNSLGYICIQQTTTQEPGVATTYWSLFVDRGVTGPTGSKGTTGSRGQTGLKGVTGSRGTTGTAGVKGTTGTAGAKGTTGTAGVKGTTGTAGAKGTTGSKGATGAKGVTGSSYLTRTGVILTPTTAGDEILATDHPTGTAGGRTDYVINACYGVGATGPTASTTTEGTIYITYTP